MLKECLVGRMAVKPIAAPKGEVFKNVVFKNYLEIARNPKSSYLQGESILT